MNKNEVSVVVVGAGISGLGTGLALDAAGFSVRILDRDPAPPIEGPASPDATSMDDVFDQWRRPGVTQLRHSHVFLARLYNLIRDRYPELRERLLAAGCRELRFEDGLPTTLREGYRPLPIDRDLTILSSRRTTLEYVMRRYVQECTGVRFENETRVTGLRIDRSADVPRLTGVEIETGEHKEAGILESTPEEARVFVDATGRTTRFPGWLAENGIDINNDVENTGILYFTRHYRLRPGFDEPVRGKVPGNGDLGYLKYGIFPADNRCFSLTLALPEDELELRKEIVKPEKFDFICSQLPGVARWTDPERAEPRSKVFGMGKLRSEWRQYLGEAGAPRVLGLFPVGDALLRSNPLYGRGCSSGVLEGHLLAQALSELTDPGRCLVRYLELVETEIRPHFESMRKQDKSSIRRAEKERDPEYRPSLKARLMKSFVEDALGPSMRSDIFVLRAFLPGFHMLAEPDRWLRSPGILWRIFRVWSRGRKRNQKRGLYLPELGPARESMFRLLGLQVEG